MKSLRVLLLGFVIALLGVSVWWFLQPAVEPSENGMSGAPSAANPPGVNAPARKERASEIAERRVARGEGPPSAVAPDALTAALAETNRFDREQALERAGYTAALGGADAAREVLEQLAGREDRAAFVRGMFARLAEGRATEALRAAKEIQGPEFTSAVETLVSHWQVELAPELEASILEMDLQSSQGRIVARLIGNPALAVEAAHALLGGSDQATVIGAAAFVEAGRDPRNALSFGLQLQGEERAAFLEAVARGWSRSKGEEAWAWASQEEDPVVRARLQSGALAGWGHFHPEAAARKLPEIADPEVRARALQVLAAGWAASDTQAALAWANTLADPQMRGQASDAIQTSAPVGIGVVLASSPEGLPLVRELVPGSPASANGILKSGYQIAAIGDGRGGFTDLRGMGTEEVAKLIRGRPGSSAILQVIPPGGSAAAPRTISIPRQQLVFKKPPAQP